MAEHGSTLENYITLIILLQFLIQNYNLNRLAVGICLYLKRSLLNKHTPKARQGACPDFLNLLSYEALAILVVEILVLNKFPKFKRLSQNGVLRQSLQENLQLLFSFLYEIRIISDDFIFDRFHRNWRNNALWMVVLDFLIQCSEIFEPPYHFKGLLITVKGTACK